MNDYKREYNSPKTASALEAPEAADSGCHNLSEFEGVDLTGWRARRQQKLGKAKQLADGDAGS